MTRSSSEVEGVRKTYHECLRVKRVSEHVKTLVLGTGSVVEGMDLGVAGRLRPCAAPSVQWLPPSCPLLVFLSVHPAGQHSPCSSNCFLAREQSVQSSTHNQSPLSTCKNVLYSQHCLCLLDSKRTVSIWQCVWLVIRSFRML